jgi:transposase
MATASTTPTMAEQLVPDEVWAAIQPLLPAKRPRPKGGRPWIEDRAVLGGIIYVLRAGVPWRLLPARELGCGSPVTCWRRLRDWQQAGVWEALHHRLLGSPAVGWSPAPGWAAIVGRWSGRWPGCWPTGASRSATSAAPTS